MADDENIELQNQEQPTDEPKEEKKGAALEEEVDLDDKAWDYAIMFSDLDPPKDKEGQELPPDHKKMIRFKENEKRRKQLVKRLKTSRLGLMVSRKRSADGKATFLLVTAKQDRLEKEAERIEMPLPLKEKFGGGYTAFEVEDRTMFEGSDLEYGFFRKNQRQYLVRSILEADSSDGGAELNIGKLIKAGVITKILPLHEQEIVDNLLQNWSHWRNLFKYQPLQEIRDYYGEEVAFYYAWLGFYTTWLWWATAVGFIVFIVHMVNRFGDSQNDYGIWFITFYSVFLAFWATFFLETWKRTSSELAFNWGMLDYENVEITRTDYKGIDANGVYFHGQWIPLDPNRPEPYPFPLPKPQKYYPTNKRRMKVASVFPLLATMIVLVVVATLAVLSFRLFVQRRSSFWGAAAGGVMNAITILIMNVVWKGLAVKLTQWENHRVQTEYDDALIFKIFVFYFVNSYTSLYYIAFLKQGFKFWGDQELDDACKLRFDDNEVEVRYTVSSGCLDELTLQLATILLTNMTIGQAKEVGVPYLLSQIRMSKFQKAIGGTTEEEEPPAVTQWERDSKKGNFEGTFEEYSEMVIQYGYITLFASAFPIAPLLAVMNNMVEIRTDAFKMLSSNTRPDYQGAKDIGNWYNVLEIVSVIAVITNCLLIGFSFSSISELLALDEFRVFILVVLMEHAILLMKFVISALIPDTPGWISKKLAFQEYVKEQVYKQMTGVKAETFEDDGQDDLNNLDNLIEQDEENQNNMMGFNMFGGR